MRILLLGHHGAGKSQLAAAMLTEFNRHNIAGWLWSFDVAQQQRIDRHLQALKQRGYLPTERAERYTMRVKMAPTRDANNRPRQVPPENVELDEYPGSVVNGWSGVPESKQFVAALGQAEGIIVVLPLDTAAPGWWYDRWLIHHLQTRVVRRDYCRFDLVLLSRNGPSADAVNARLAPWRTFLAALGGRCETTVVDLSSIPSSSAGVPLFLQLRRINGLANAPERRLETALAAAGRPSTAPAPPAPPAAPAAPGEHLEATAKAATLRVAVLGPQRAGRTSLLCALHRQLGPESHGLWLNPLGPDDMAGLIVGWEALAAGEDLPQDTAARPGWNFELVNGIRPLLTAAWTEATAPEGLPVQAASAGVDPVSGAHVVLAAVPSELLAAPVTPGSAGALRAVHGMIEIDAAISRAILAARAPGGHPPLILICVTKSHLLADPAAPEHARRTREGVLEDLRALLPAAFADGAVTTVCVTAAAAPENGPHGVTYDSRGVTDVAHLLLIADLARQRRLWLRQEDERERRNAAFRPGTAAPGKKRMGLIGALVSGARAAATGTGKATIAHGLEETEAQLETVIAELPDVSVFIDGRPDALAGVKDWLAPHPSG